MDRLSEAIERDRVEGYKKVAMQAKPSIWQKVKLVANIENRHIHEVVNEAIIIYLDENYPNLNYDEILKSIK